MNSELLKKLIKFRTVYGKTSEFFKCFEYIKNYLKNSSLYIKEYSFNGFKSMVIANDLVKDFDVIFVGHIDVVSGNDEQFTPFVKNNKLYGRGSFDMKGHVSVMIEIMRNLSLIKTPYKVALFITSDEEMGGFYGTKKLLDEIKYSAKLAIVPDAGNNFALVTEEKGVLQLKLSYQGKSAHSSLPFDGNNALDALINIYNELQKKYPLPKNKKDFRTSINLSMINGGSEINKVCDNASMVLDIRYVACDKKKDIIDFIKNKNSKVNIEILAEGDEFLYIESELSKKYLKSCKSILNKKIVITKCESSSDARFFYKRGISCIMMNAKGQNLHGDNEYIKLESLDNLYEIYKEFLIGR